MKYRKYPNWVIITNKEIPFPYTQPDFKVGDWVIIDARNMKTKRPSKKLDHKKIGPVKSLKKIGTRALRVELPTTIEVHNVFHVSLLEPYRKSKVPSRDQPPPPPEEVEGEENWEVESVANSRYNKERKRVEYLVGWKGLPLEQASWEPWESLEGTAEEAIQLFHKSNPKLPNEGLIGTYLFLGTRFEWCFCLLLLGRYVP
jgi:hypothetical protein